ncbi:PD40 domain-containing protein [Flavobacterium psychrophilum]|uniref:TolB family protein n=1 Tax=Flavobacterium psychrophilum TaxID=96345 RepID=UPI000B7C0C21|nr:PD40 domain-containing protein [Flavobacterium psychrophilum]MCB6069751.1 PD40 domain-containing protein [Flavobacterium psychrophilum]MCB6079476.1 PD40 domain-containing protein [Flavobacterium psychrophilum]MCB6091969.1 PD40 domain-containing protein [Flavobacterium psychrophilum]MCB6094447.1 PD40 domain-containing protein [Flavobacterium psychrophilum]MCB6131491.1 PD40 domain-containing protein [Flavobacterium psychrophilum]
MKIKNLLKSTVISAIILTSCSKTDENVTIPNIINPTIGKILFEAKVGTNYQLFTMNSDGTNETQITNFINGTNYIYTGDASWNSDGTKIIFFTNKDNDGGSKIYISSPDGTNLTRIVHVNVNIQNPRLSPNGTKILFEAKIGNNYHLFTMNVNGTNETQITNFSNGTNYIYTGDASWNSDGTKIIFMTNKDYDSGSKIYICNSDGTNLTRINHVNVNIQNPRLSPNGTKILFEAKIGNNYHLFTMNLNGTNETQITNFSNGTNYIYTGDASYNSDGTKIVFTTNKDYDNGSGIYTMNSDGTNIARINHNARDEQNPSWKP